MSAQRGTRLQRAVEVKSSSEAVIKENDCKENSIQTRYIGEQILENGNATNDEMAEIVRVKQDKREKAAVSNFGFQSSVQPGLGKTCLYFSFLTL